MHQSSVHSPGVSPCVAAQLSKRCPNNRYHRVHEHIQLINGRPRAAQQYPPGLCRAIMGIRQQIKADSKGQLLLAQVGIEEIEDSKRLMKVAKELHSKCRTVEEEDHDS